MDLLLFQVDHPLLTALAVAALLALLIDKRTLRIFGFVVVPDCSIGAVTKVIARFGSMEARGTQLLEPTIGNCFRNAAQDSDVIDCLKKRSERPADTKAAIAAALKACDIRAVETLIGDTLPPAELMKTLADRKFAEQEKPVPEVQVGGGSSAGQGGTLVDFLLAGLVKDRLAAPPQRHREPEPLPAAP